MKKQKDTTSYIFNIYLQMYRYNIFNHGQNENISHIIYVRKTIDIILVISMRKTLKLTEMWENIWQIIINCFKYFTFFHDILINFEQFVYFLGK